MSCKDPTSNDIFKVYDALVVLPMLSSATFRLVRPEIRKTPRKMLIFKTFQNLSILIYSFQNINSTPNVPAQRGLSSNEAVISVNIGVMSAHVPHYADNHSPLVVLKQL
jgi:hypothetical protein